jgi:pimeloyl-ACP methyl ester carboxylesterase
LQIQQTIYYRRMAASPCISAADLIVIGCSSIAVMAIAVCGVNPLSVETWSEFGGPGLDSREKLMPLSPFRVAITDEVLHDLHRRVSDTRYTVATAPDRAAGVDPGYLRDLMGYWAKSFDWRAHERGINAYPHFIAQMGADRVHFVHVKGKAPPDGTAPIPLLLLHGWPSAFTEMYKIIPLLTNPSAHGCNPADVFDIVVPSLPGVAFSPITGVGALTRPRMADMFARLMSQELGYARFGVYGGDVGADVGHWLATRHPDKVVGLHLIHPRLPSAVIDQAELTPRECSYLADRVREDKMDGGYSHEQATRPDTLAAALIDSPAGLAAWIVEKLRAWSDCAGDVESRFSKDEILTLLTLYWATSCIGTSFRSYFDYEHNPPRAKCDLPTGITVSAEDAGHPRELAERVYSDIRMWREHGRGGHFFPFEEPLFLAKDLREFFGSLGRRT